MRTIGFKPGRCTTDLAGIIIELIRYAYMFKVPPLVAVSQDIKTALDDISMMITQPAVSIFCSSILNSGLMQKQQQH